MILFDEKHPIISELLKLLSFDKTVLAIDGRCAAGKTSLALFLASQTGAEVIHGDDFFPPKAERASRFPSDANIDGRRLLDEVLIPLSKGDPVCYGIFDCQTQTVVKQQPIHRKTALILEGSYLLHPAFRFAYTHTLFLNTEAETQRLRIQNRNGKKAGDFFEKWIPAEERYIQIYRLPAKNDLYLLT